MTAPQSSNRWALALAFFIVYIVWGSTYLANIIAIETIPPFVLVVARLCTAGLLLLGFARFVSKAPFIMPTRQQWKNLALTSVLFLTIGLGAVVWAEQYIESGTTALLVAVEPLLVVLVLWGFDKKRPRWQAFAGIALGIVGTLVLVGQDVVIAGEGAWMGILAILVGILAWAFGSVLTSRVELLQNRVQTAGWQMLLAGAMAIPFVLATGDASSLDISSISSRSWWAFGFLVLFGSIIAYSAFLYLLQRVSPEKVATSTYVHPVVALSLGVLFRGEIVTTQTIVACVILLAGVLFVNGNWGRRKRSALVQPRQAIGGAIMRRWSGRAMPGKEAEFETFLEHTVLPQMRAANGNLEAVIAKPFGKTGGMLTVQSRWIDGEAEQDYIAGDVARPKAFAGEEAFIDTDSENIEREEIARQLV